MGSSHHATEYDTMMKSEIIMKSLRYQVGITTSLYDTILNYLFLTSHVVFLLPRDIYLDECALLDAFHELL